MARLKSKWVVSLEYYPLRGLFWLLGVLPWNTSLFISHTLLRGLFGVIPKRRRITDENLAQAFPELDSDGRRRITDASLANLSRGVAMFARIPRLRQEELDGLVCLEGLNHVQEALARGRGVLTFTAHYGCWEAMAAYIPRWVPSAIVVRPLDNPRLEELVTEVRASGGCRIIPRRQALKEGLKVLKNNAILGILIDQNFASGGVFVDFLGRPAATTPIVSLLARRMDCPVLPLHNAWDGNKIRIIFEPPIALSRQTDRTLAAAEDTQTMSRVVEGWIRDDPGQWLWLHHRWKRKPQPGDFVYRPSENGAVPAKPQPAGL